MMMIGNKWSFLSKLNSCNYNYNSKRGVKKDLRLKVLSVKGMKSKNQTKNLVQTPEFYRKKRIENNNPVDNELDLYNEDPEVSSFENIANEISNSRGKYHREARQDKAARFMIGQMKQARYRTIERKYFKKEKRLNLLTWRAKEQMRYLHCRKTDPWSLDELIDSYPICDESILKVLNSRIRLSLPEQIEWHDRGIILNWLNVKNMLENRNENLPEYLVKGLFDSDDNNCLISNADGLIDELFPVKKTFFKGGPFSNIVKDCVRPRTLPEFQIEGELSIKKVLDGLQTYVENEKLTASFLLNSTLENEQETATKDKTINDDNMKETIALKNSWSGTERHSKFVQNKVYKPSAIYQKGNSIYDENGDFLYSLP